MRFLLQCLIAATLFVGPAALAQAACPTYGYSSYSTPYYAPYVEKIERRTVVIEYVPTFAVGYAAPYVAAPYVAPVAPPVAAPAYTMPAPVSTCEQRLAAFEQKFNALEARLLAGGVGVGGASAPHVQPPRDLPRDLPRETAQPPANPRGVFLGTCAKCHDVKTAAASGKGIIFSDGPRMVPLSAELVGKAIREVTTGKMPKGGKLTDQEFSAFLQEIVDMQGR